MRKRPPQILALLLAAGLAVPVTVPATVYAQGYSQLTADAQFTSNFEYENGLNYSSSGTAVFTDGEYAGQTVNDSSRMLADGASATLRIPNGFVYYDGNTYDIGITVTNTSGKEYGGSWVCFISGGANPFLTLQPSSASGTSFDYEIWLEKDGSRVTTIDLVAGSCYTARVEGARPWGDDGSIYTNTSIAWDSTNQCWTPTTGSADSPSVYILGHGKTESNSIKGGYVRKSGTGGAEMVIGYLVKTIKFQNEANAQAGALSSTEQKTEVGKAVKAPTASPNAGYYLKNWTADVDVTLSDGTVITAGNAITPAQLETVLANTDITFTAHYAACSVATETDGTAGGQSLVVKDEDGNPLTTMTITANGTSYNGNNYNNGGTDVTVSGLDEVKKYFPSAVLKNTTYVVAGEDGSVSDTPTTNANDGAQSDGAAPKDAGTYYIKETYTINGNDYTVYTKFVIDPKALTVNVTANDKEYDGNTTATLKSESIDTGVDGDSFTVSGSQVAFTDKNAGEGKTVTVTGTTATPNGATKAKNYTITYPTETTATITPKTVTATVSAQDKTYDGKTTATASASVESGVIDGESITISGVTSGTFEDANAGEGKKVTVDISAANVTAGANTNINNYNVVIPAETTATINKKVINATVSAKDKDYDGKTAAETGATVKTGIEGESISISGTTGTFEDANAAKDKKVSVDSSKAAITGAEGTNVNNYEVKIPTETTATINKKVVTATVTAKDKTYDGKTDAETSATVETGVDNESISISGTTGAFEDANAGKDKTVTVDSANASVKGENGTNLNNYTVVIPSKTTATINKKAVTATVTAKDKAYDGKTDAETGATVETGIDGEKLTISGTTGTFDNANAGTDKKVSVDTSKAEITGAAGTNVSNYEITIPTETTATINKKAITAAVSAKDKTYDGKTDAETEATVETGVEGESITISGTTGTFENANAGTDKKVTVDSSKAEIAGNDGTDTSNYEITIPTEASATINKKVITATVTAKNKTYDGKTDAQADATVETGIDGEKLTIDGLTGTFDTANAGTGKTVAVDASKAKVTGEDGTNADNYEVQYPETAAADIAKAPGTAQITNLDKLTRTFDGKSTAAAVTSNSNGKQTVYYRQKNGAWTTTVPTAAGEYEVKVVVAEDENHTAAEATGTFTITAKAAATPTTTPKDSSAVKSDSAKTGDTSMPFAYGVSAALAGAAAAVALVLRKKKR